MYIVFNLSDEIEEEGEMLACQLESEEKEKKMVTIAVTIEEELLNRIETNLQLEEELHFITQRETGELPHLYIVCTLCFKCQLRMGKVICFRTS